MDSNELWIKTQANQDALANFPMLSGQYMDREEPSNDDGDDWKTAWIIIDLGNKTDITAAQKQWLDSNDLVIGYEII